MSWSLLGVGERKTILIVTGVQILTALLDLAGVLLLGAVTGLAVAQFSGTGTPVVILDFIDAVGLGQFTSEQLIWILAAIAGALLIAKSLVNTYLTRRILRFLARRQASISGLLTRALLTEPLVFIQNRSTQNTTYALIGGVSAATVLVIGQGIVVVTELALLITMSVGLFFIDWQITLGAGIYFALVAFLLHRTVSGWSRKLGTQVSEAEVVSYSTIQEALLAYRELTVANLRNEYALRFERLRWQASDLVSSIQFVGLAPKYIFEVALVIGGALLVLSQLGRGDSASTLATLTIFVAAGTRIAPSLMRLQGAATSVQSGAGQAEPTFALAKELGLIGLSKNVDENSSFEAYALSQTQIGSLNPTVNVSNLSIRYPNSHTMALENVSLSIKAGERVAFIGPSGSGKSTLVDAILGVVQPLTGYVDISGLPPSQAISMFPDAIGYVPQHVFLFNSTVRQNVALGREPSEVDDSQVWRALRQADIADFLLDEREGLDTLIGEHGVQLSGGQRQRLGIARALYSNPTLLILDEATSALDASTEDAIVKGLESLDQDVTVIVIAHRLSTVANSDRVYYLDGGRIKGQGDLASLRSEIPDLNEQAKLSGL